MTGALISFAAFAGDDARGALGWRRAMAAVHDDADAALPAVVGRAYWRVHALNNRELARSALLYPSIPAAREHASHVARQIARVTISTFIMTSARSIGWYATLDGEPIMMCARWYEGTSVASQAASKSVAVLASVAATVSPRPVEVVR